MNEDKKIKYTLWIAIIGLLTIIVSQWNVLFPKPQKEETQQQIAQPNINVTNEIKIDNKAQNNNPGKSSEPKKEGKITSPEWLDESEPTKIDVGRKRKYFSRVKDKNGNGVANVEIHCSNCIVKNVKTNQEGGFHLEGYFDENATFWQSSLTLSKDKITKTETINWREKSPEPINF